MRWYIVRAIIKSSFVYLSPAPEPLRQFKITMTVLPHLPLLIQEINLYISSEFLDLLGLYALFVFTVQFHLAFFHFFAA